MQKFRADKGKAQSDGAIVWHSEWNYGPSLAKITNCRLATMAGDMRRTVYITGEADTFFSQPAICKLMGKRVKGYVTSEGNGCLVFNHVYY